MSITLEELALAIITILETAEVDLSYTDDLVDYCNDNPENYITIQSFK